MIALSRGVFERRCDIAGFQQRIVRENLFAGRARSQEIEHVLDANAQTPQAGPAAALVRIKRNALQFAHSQLQDLPAGKTATHIAQRMAVGLRSVGARDWRLGSALRPNSSVNPAENRG